MHPDEYAKRLNLLKKDGLKVTVYDEKKLKKLGMHALLEWDKEVLEDPILLQWSGMEEEKF